MTTIVLKNRLNENITFTYAGRTSQGAVFDSPGATLLDRKRITLQLGENQNVNRVKMKISVPVLNTSVAGAAPTVSYTQVASGDITVVRFADEANREDIVSLFSSLAGSATVLALATEGILPVA